MEEFVRNPRVHLNQRISLKIESLKSEVGKNAEVQAGVSDLDAITGDYFFTD